MISVFSSSKKFIRVLAVLLGLSMHSIAAAEGIYICQSIEGPVVNFAHLYLDTRGMWGQLTYTAPSLGLDEKFAVSQAGNYFYGSTDLTSAAIYLFPDASGGFAHLILTLKAPNDDKQVKINIGCAIPI